MNLLSVRRRAGAVVAALAVSLVTFPAVQLPASPPAQAATRVSITSKLGNAAVSVDGPTEITVDGAGFQSIKGGFGGIYVLFGWIRDGAWQPSAGGKTGEDLLYVPDSETKDNKGYEKFVTFPGSETAAAANGGEINADGTWHLTMTVPGPAFTAEDRAGHAKSVNCLQVQCGVITIGAHGVVNPANESFTPVTYTGAAGQAGANGPAAESADAGSGEGSDTGIPGAEGSAGAGAPSGTAAGPAQTEAAGPATIGLDNPTIIAGRVLGFHARGFKPGEQVTATISSGLVGAGPLAAGPYGEVAGAVQLPADLRAGTQVIKIVAASSGKTAQTEFSVVADASLLNAQAASTASGTGWKWPLIVAITAGSFLLLLVLTSLLTALMRRRRSRRDAKAQPPPLAKQDPPPAAGLHTGSLPFVGAGERP